MRVRVGVIQMIQRLRECVQMGTGLVPWRWPKWCLNLGDSTSPSPKERVLFLHLLKMKGKTEIRKVEWVKGGKR